MSAAAFHLQSGNGNHNKCSRGDFNDRVAIAVAAND